MIMLVCLVFTGINFGLLTVMLWYIYDSVQYGIELQGKKVGW